jgi:peptide/nickel transport system permease protein
LELYLQGVLDAVMAFPLITMALAVVAVFGTGVRNVMTPFLILLTTFVGQAIQGGAEEYASMALWIAVFPGLATVFTVFGVSLFGDALRRPRPQALRPLSLGFSA